MKSINKELRELQKAYSRGLMTKYEFYLRHYNLKQEQRRQHLAAGSMTVREPLISTGSGR